MEKLKPKAVIFDLGSTLIEYEAIPWADLSIDCVESVRKYLLKKKYDVPDKEEFFNRFEKVKAGYRKVAAETMVEWNVPKATLKFMEQLNIEVEDGLADKLFQAYYKPVKEKLFAYDDTLEMVQKIKNKIGVVGLVSNTIFPEETHMAELSRFDIKIYFDFTIFSSTFGVRKPHQDIFYKALNLAGVAPSEAVYIGDRYLEDVIGPTEIGMNAILKIKTDREYPKDMPEAIRRIDNLSELADHIDLD